MGYYTRYRLTVWDHKTEKNVTSDYIKSYLNSALVSLSFTWDEIDQEIRADLHWFDHEDEMKALSFKEPTYCFHLKGKGDDETDVWTKYFYQGQMQVESTDVDPPSCYLTIKKVVEEITVPLSNLEKSALTVNLTRKLKERYSP